MINNNYASNHVARTQDTGMGRAKNCNNSQVKGNPRFNGTPLEQTEIRSSVLGLVQQLLALLQKGGKPDTPTAPAALNLSSAQESNLKHLLGFTDGAPVGVQLLDEDGDGQISVGDTAIVSGGITGGEILRHTLTQQDLNVVNNAAELPQDFTDNLAKWEAASSQPNSGITYQTQSSCFCPQDYTRPMSVTEQNGRIVSANYTDGEGEAVPDYVRDNLFTVDERFEQLQAAYESGAERIDATYDGEFGFPTSVFIDQSSMIADEETRYSISGLQFSV